MAVSIDESTAKMIAALPEKTGRALAEWQKLISRSGKTKHGEIVAWLKSDHGVTHGYANLIAHKSLGSDAGSKTAEGEDLVAQSYSGAKAALKPVHDALIAQISKFGPDVELAPKKGYVSLRRSKQFGLIQPSTATRVDVGIQLKGTPPAGRLEASGSFNAMVSHRVRVASITEVDAELVGWLKKAYDQA